MRKILAGIAAIAMVVGAYVVRTEVIQPGADTGVAVDTPANVASAGTVACDSRLGAACPTGSVRVGAADLVTAFASPDYPYDGVVAPQFVIDMITESGRSRVAFGDPTVVATSPMVLVTATRATTTVGDACQQPPTWECIAATIQSGDLMPSLADPATTSDGIAALAGLAGGYFSTVDAPYNLNGFNTGDFIGWLDAIQREGLVSSSGVENIIRFSGAQNDSALVTEATARDVIGRAAQDDLTILFPEPLVVVSVVAVDVQGSADGGVDGIAEVVGQALTDSGWRGPEGLPVSDDGPPLPDEDGLPSGGVLVALAQRWR